MINTSSLIVLFDHLFRIFEKGNPHFEKIFKYFFWNEII